MIDEIAIQQTLNLYSISATTGDHEAMVGTFVPDGIWEVPDVGIKCKGREEIITAAGGITGKIEYMSQVNSPALITIDGDTATARSVIRECGKYVGRQTSLEVLGLYNDTLARTADGWRFTKRTFSVIGMHDFETAPPSLHE